jgi:anti-sigma factor (TIGR02949 family)
MADEPIHTETDDLACVEVVELVADYLEGSLPEDDARRLERHLDTCPGCSEYLQQLRTIAGSLRGLTDESFPVEMRDGLLAEFRDLHDR